MGDGSDRNISRHHDHPDYFNTLYIHQFLFFFGIGVMDVETEQNDKYRLNEVTLRRRVNGAVRMGPSRTKAFVVNISYKW